MKRILLIEDNLEIRENIAELLGLLGYSVLSASNGRAGVDMARSHLPDIILSDIMMPLLDGHQVLGVLRADPATKHIPFIFASSSVEKKIVDAAFAGGASGFLKKPFEEEELVRTIEVCLSGGICR